MLKTKKEAVVLLFAVFILVLGIFSVPENEVIELVEVTGAVTGMATADECANISAGRIMELRGALAEKIYPIEFLYKLWYDGLLYTFNNFKTLPSGNVTNAMYLTEMRDFLRELSQYYWNLERISPAPNNIRGIDVEFVNLSGSDEPASYYYTYNELFQQAFGQDGWTNPQPTCISEVDLAELEEATARLEWLFISLGSIPPTQYEGVRWIGQPFLHVESIEWKKGDALDSNLDTSWAKTIEKFSSSGGTINTDKLIAYREHC